MHGIPVQLSKIRAMSGRKIVGHRAMFAAFSRNANTPAEAIDRLATAIETASLRLEQGAYIGRWREHTILVSPTLDGWQVWNSTQSQTYAGTFVPERRRVDVVRSAYADLAKGLWTADLDDATYIASVPELDDTGRRELQTYFQWQRDYRAFAAQGYDDTQIRDLLFQGTRPTADEITGITR